MYDCPFPHHHCDQLACQVKSRHAHYLPCTACPYYRLHNARAHLTPQEEDDALQDLIGEVLQPRVQKSMVRYCYPCKGDPCLGLGLMDCMTRDDSVIPYDSQQYDFHK